MKKAVAEYTFFSMALFGIGLLADFHGASTAIAALSPWVAPLLPLIATVFLVLYVSHALIVGIPQIRLWRLKRVLLKECRKGNHVWEIQQGYMSHDYAHFTGVKKCQVCGLQDYHNGPTRI